MGAPSRSRQISVVISRSVVVHQNRIDQVRGGEERMPLSLEVLWRARRMAPGRPAPELEDKANMLTAISCQRSVACSRQLMLAPSGGTRGGGVEPALDVEQRRLAQARRTQ